MIRRSLYTTVIGLAVANSLYAALFTHNWDRMASDTYMQTSGILIYIMVRHWILRTGDKDENTR